MTASFEKCKKEGCASALLPLKSRLRATFILSARSSEDSLIVSALLLLLLHALQQI
jgi:hypothetical protein